MSESQICECGVYMHVPRKCPDGVYRCAACYCVATRVVQATTRLNLRRYDPAGATGADLF